MDEATQNAIAEATTRLDAAKQAREEIAAQDTPNFAEMMGELAVIGLLVQEAQAWATVATAAAIAGSAPEMPSLGDIMSQLTGGAGT